jgi:hypothetical protein
MLDVIFLGALVMAIARAVRGRFTWGIVAGVLRLLLVIASVWMVGIRLLSSGMGLHQSPLSLLVFVAGPLVSFSMVFLTWRHKRSVPLLEEEAFDRVFMPWIAVACVDAASMCLGLFAVVLAATA